MKNTYSKKTNLLLLLCFVGSFAFAQNFAWMKGSNSIGPSGVYGTIGVPAINNTPGGRDVGASWKDANGNFWLFGGEGYDGTGVYGDLNDLWKYDAITNQWTWMKGSSSSDQAPVYGTIGVAAPANNPGARAACVSWADGSGNLWLFGGSGIDAFANNGELNDLWKYNIASNQWTWMKGTNTALQGGTYGTLGTAAANNLPGGRVASATWADASGNLWLFGGTGYDGASNYGDLGDLWKYNITSNQWTWMHGFNITDQSGVYGSIGVSAAANRPGGRYLGNFWNDASGNLWMFGGAGFDAASNVEDLLSDLWKYNPTTNQWTWIKGSSTSAQSGIYGTQGVAAPSNAPGGRLGGNSWADASGNFFLFGGLAYDGSGGNDFINDLWKYNITANQWTWTKGSNTISQTGTYGTLGVGAVANMPGARLGASGWTDASYSLWLFGGIGYDATGPDPDDLNDLWRLSSCVNPPNIVVIASPSSVCLGNPVNLSASGAVSYLWNTGQTGAVISATPSIAIPTVYSTAGIDQNGCTGTATVLVNVLALPTVTASSNKGIICKGEEVVITASGANTYSWSTSPVVSAPSITVSPLGTTNYVVAGTGANGCISTYTVSQTVNLCTGIEAGVVSSNPYIIYPNPNNSAFTVSGQGFKNGDKLIVFNTLGQKVFEESLRSDQTNIQTQLAKGIYHYNIIQGEQKISSGKVMIE